MSMCCNECEKYYNNICSYNKLVPTGDLAPRVLMNSVTLKVSTSLSLSPPLFPSHFLSLSLSFSLNTCPPANKGHTSP